MGAVKGHKRQYAAFLSYAHADERIAKKVQRSLETYTLPKHLKSQRHILSPIFRDVTELTASHSLSERINEAVAQSRFLIVLCSPAAKQSEWVNKEIRLFRRLHGEGSIFCALIEGTPDKSFPLALIEEGREPLAADMTRQKERFKFGITQIVASMLSVGLDDLILRERHRQRRRVMAVTTVSTIALLIMSTLTWTAITARQDAERRRADAEGLIEFMVTDLKDNLESVGSLDALQGVGERASAYYDGYDPSNHDDDALGRRSRIMHFLGDIQAKLGHFKDANRHFQDAFTATEILLQRDPTHPDRIFEHAKSAFWLANDHYEKGHYLKAQPFYQDYLSLAELLLKTEGETDRARAEMASAHANLGQLAKQMSDFAGAEQSYIVSMQYKLALSEAHPENFKYMDALVSAYSKLADLSFSNGRLDESLKYWMKSEGVIQDFLKAGHKSSYESDARLLYKRTRLKRAIARLKLYRGDATGADEYVKAGLKLARRILSIEPKNVDIKFEEISFQILAFEIAYQGGQFHEAHANFETIKTLKANLPFDFQSDRRFRQLEHVLSNMTLYLSLISGDIESTRKTAETALKAIPDNFEVSSSELRYHILTRIALINLILSDQKTDAVLTNICTSETEALTILERKVLWTHMGADVCSGTYDSENVSTLFQYARKTYLTLLNK